MVDLGFDLEQIWVRSLSECPPEWCSVAAFAVLVCSLLPLSSPVSSSGCFGLIGAFILLLCYILAPSDSSLHVSHLLIGASCSSAFKLQKEDCYCLRPLLMLCEWIPLCSGSVIATSGVNFTRSDGRTRTCRPCFACPSVGVALGMVCGPSDRSPVSYEQCDFEAGPGFKRNTLVSC
ncbi:hypothetical protein F2Q70_00026443 [Brassica cretica]|uniref:Uncharacterized protein n=1 Tax=Brassica cretica TaxID=69181 RepID=A0A8S9LHV9_BRACR|nr:hypothetical protein F2Q70_00026443 [Brassica cretica]